MSKILIAFSTRFGTTAEISERIKSILKDKGHEVENINLTEIKSRNWPKPEEYDGILVGTSIKMGMWKKESKKFLKKHSDIIRTKKTGIFVTCGLAAEKDKIPKAKRDYIEKITKKYDLPIDLQDAFGGVYDLSENTSMGKINQKIMKMVAAEDPNIELGICNDFRDWAQIESFAEEFDKLIK